MLIRGGNATRSLVRIVVGIRWMRIVHVDENGEPDQPFGLVLKKVLTLQLLILPGLSLIFAFVLVAARVFGLQFGIDVLP